MIVRRIETEYSAEDEIAFDAPCYRVTIEESQPLTTIWQQMLEMLIRQGIEQGAVKVEQDRLYLHRFSPLLVIDNQYLVLMYTKVNLCSIF